MKKPKPKGEIKWEMILAWSTSKRPFVTQKLGFKASAKFSVAYKEAKRLVKVLWKAGGFQKPVVKLLSLSAAGVLTAYQAENAPYLLKRQEELKAQVKRFNKEGKDDSREAKAAFKAKPIKEKDGAYQFTVGGEDKPKKKTKPPKVVVQEKPKPRYDASKTKKKKVNK